MDRRLRAERYSRCMNGIARAVSDLQHWADERNFLNFDDALRDLMRYSRTLHRAAESGEVFPE